MWGKEQLRVMVHDFTRPLEKNSVAGYATYSRSLKDADRIKLRTLFLEVLWEEYKSAKDAMDRAPIGVKYEAISAMVDYSLVNTQVAEKNSNLLNALVNQAEEGEGDVNFNEILADLIVLPSKNLKLKDTNRDKVLGIADRLRKKFQESRKQYKQSNLSPYTEDSTTNNEQNDFTLVSTTQEDEQDVNINNQPEKPTKKQRAVLRRQVEAQQRQAEKALKLLQKEAEIKLEKEIPRIEAVHTPTETTVTSPTNHNGVVNTKPKATASTPSSSKLLNTLAKQSNLKFSDTITRLLDLIEDAYEAAKANYFLAIQLPLKDHSVDQVYELFQALVEISVENKNQIGNLAPYLSGVVVCHAARMPSSTRNTPLIELILTLTENDLNDKNKWPEIFARFYKEASLTTFIHSRTESERYIHISYVIWFITAASSGIMPPTLNIKETTLILLKGSEILDFINLFDEYALMIQTQELQDSMSEKNVLVKVLNSKSIDYIQSNDNRGALHQALRAVLPSQAEVHKVLYGARKYYKLQEQHQSMPIDEVGYRLSVLVDFEYTVVNQLEPIIKILLSKMPLCKILFDDNARNELFKNTLCPVLGVLMPYRHGLAVQELFMHPDNLADFELLITCAIAFINQYTALSSFHLIQVAPGGEI